MDASLFVSGTSGVLVPISGHDPWSGEWHHVAFVPNPLPKLTPNLTAATFNAVANARASLAALDASAKGLPEPGLLRLVAVRREAQSTSALEGTYAPLASVLAADQDTDQGDANLREVVNYVRAAEAAFAWVAQARPITVGLLIELQRLLVRGTPAENEHSGRLRDIQVVIGSHSGTRVQDARFIPAPPGTALDAQVRDLVDWITAGNPDLDPVVAAGMAHYQFEALHPFNDGNGRVGRLLIVLQLLSSGVLAEPTLTVSPWFEARRGSYYEHLFGVSARGDWDSWLRFFADGLAAAAQSTERQLRDLIAVQADLHARIRNSGLRGNNALRLVDYVLQQPIFTVRMASAHLGLSYPRANALVAQLVEEAILRQYGDAAYDRQFTAPDILAILLRPS